MTLGPEYTRYHQGDARQSQWFSTVYDNASSTQQDGQPVYFDHYLMLARFQAHQDEIAGLNTHLDAYATRLSQWETGAHGNTTNAVVGVNLPALGDVSETRAEPTAMEIDAVESEGETASVEMGGISEPPALEGYSNEEVGAIYELPPVMRFRNGVPVIDEPLPDRLSTPRPRAPPPKRS